MRVAFVLILSTVLAVIGLYGYRAQSFNGFVGSNDSVSTIHTGP